MNWIIRASTITVFLFAFQLLGAQEVLSDELAEVKKKEIIEVSKLTHSISADFVQRKKLDFLPTPVKSKGKFYYLSPDKIKWVYTDPEPYIICMNGGTIMVEDQGIKSIIDMNTYLSKSEAGNLLSLDPGTLLNDPAYNYLYSLESDKLLVSMEPKDENLYTHQSMKLTFFQESKQLSEIKFLESDGYTAIQFVNTKFNQRLNPYFFSVSE